MSQTTHLKDTTNQTKSMHEAVLKNQRNTPKIDDFSYHWKNNNKQTNKQKPTNGPVCLSNNDFWLPDMVS